MSGKDDGLKSSFDLAMERLAAKGDAAGSITEEQKKALAEVDSEVQAKIAEVEILTNQSLAVARASGDVQKITQLEAEKKDEIRRIRDRGEMDKEGIRKGEGKS